MCAISGIGCGLRPGRRTPIGNRPETDPGPHTLRVPLYLQLHFQMCRVMRCVACIGGVGSPRYGAARAKTRYSLRIFYSFIRYGITRNARQSKTDVGRLYTLSSLIVVGNSYEFLNGSLLFGDGLESLYVYFTFDQRYALRDLHAPEGPLRCVPVCATAQACHTHSHPPPTEENPNRTEPNKRSRVWPACCTQIACVWQ